jgi:hypothetical protein
MYVWESTFVGIQPGFSAAARRHVVVLIVMGPVYILPAGARAPFL